MAIGFEEGDVTGAPVAVGALSLAGAPVDCTGGGEDDVVSGERVLLETGASDIGAFVSVVLGAIVAFSVAVWFTAVGVRDTGAVAGGVGADLVSSAGDVVFTAIIADSTVAVGVAVAPVTDGFPGSTGTAATGPEVGIAGPSWGGMFGVFAGEEAMESVGAEGAGGSDESPPLFDNVTPTTAIMAITIAVAATTQIHFGMPDHVEEGDVSVPELGRRSPSVELLMGCPVANSVASSCTTTCLVDCA